MSLVCPKLLCVHGMEAYSTQGSQHCGGICRCQLPWILHRSLLCVGKSKSRALETSAIQMLMLPQGISVGAKLFPPEIHSTALAFVFVNAQIGGCLFPIITGVIASRAGVAVLQPMLCGLMVATAISWLLVPKPKESRNPALHED